MNHAALRLVFCKKKRLTKLVSECVNKLNDVRNTFFCILLEETYIVTSVRKFYGFVWAC